MARIVFFCDLEEGHLFPSFALAKTMQNAGHEILYMVVEDNIPLVRAAGFNAEIIFSEVYPKGTLSRHHAILKDGAEKRFVPHLDSLIQGALNKIIETFSPEKLYVSYFLPLETLLLHYLYRIPLVIFNPSLRNEFDTPHSESMNSFMGLEGIAAASILDFVTGKCGAKISKLQDMFDPMRTFQEIILCPKELDFPDRKYINQNVIHVGSSIRESDLIKQDFDIPVGKKVVYISFGSQISLFLNQYITFVKMVLAMMRTNAPPEWYVIISLGNLVDAETFEELPDNVKVVKWVPQLVVLKHSSVMITHGGLGSIKECIHAGVPMIVIPLTRDQPMNADRVVYHKLGKKCDIETVDSTELFNMIDTLIEDSEVRASVAQMRQIFEKKDGEMQDKILKMTLL